LSRKCTGGQCVATSSAGGTGGTGGGGGSGGAGDVNGTPCTSGATCQSTVCADAVCCDQACLGICRGCLASLSGAQDGLCAMYRAGSDPQNECNAGYGCDGAGACINAKSFGSSANLENDNAAEATDPAVAIGGARVGMAVWAHGPSGTRQVRYSIHKQGAWSADQQIPNPNDVTAYVFAPSVSINRAGKAVVAWITPSGPPAKEVWASLYDPASGFGDGEKIGSGSWIRQVATSIDDQGNAVVVWDHDPDTGESELRYNERSSGQAWGTEKTLWSVGQTGSFDFVMTTSPGGAAMVVWDDLYNGKYTVHASRRSPGYSWGGIESVESPATRTSTLNDALTAAITPNGSALIVWAAYDSGLSKQILWTATRTPTTTWGTLGKIDNPSHSPTIPQVALSASGKAAVIWCHWRQTGRASFTWDVATNLFDGTSWGTAEVQQNGGADCSADSSPVWAGADPSGNFVLAWKVASKLTTRQYLKGAWLTAVEHAVNPGRLRATVGEAGDAVFAWQELVNTALSTRALVLE
jgi:hypothetical protein